MKRAKIIDGWAYCPTCRPLVKLCRMHYGGEARGVELWCKRCKSPVLLEAGARREK